MQQPCTELHCYQALVLSVKTVKIVSGNCFWKCKEHKNISIKPEQSHTRQTDIRRHCFPFSNDRLFAFFEWLGFLHQRCHHRRFMFAIIILQYPHEAVTWRGQYPPVRRRTQLPADISAASADYFPIHASDDFTCSYSRGGPFIEFKCFTYLLRGPSCPSCLSSIFKTYLYEWFCPPT